MCFARKRTLDKGVLSDLTARQWGETLQYFGYACAYCRRLYFPPDGFTTLELGHVVPVALGGATTKANCIPTCTGCNGRLNVQDPTRADCYVPISTSNGARLIIRDFVDANGGLVPVLWPVMHFEDAGVVPSPCGTESPHHTVYPWEVTCRRCREHVMALCHPFPIKVKLPSKGNY